MIDAHFQMLYDTPRYKDAWAFVAAEANMSYLDVDMIENILKKFPRVIMLRQDSSKLNRAGVWTGPHEKENYAAGLQRTLVNNMLYFAEDMVGGHLERDKNELLKQLSLYRKEVKAPPEPMHGTYKVTYGGKSHGCKDDLAMSLQICLYWMLRTRISQDFRDRAKKMGWTRV